MLMKSWLSICIPVAFIFPPKAAGSSGKSLKSSRLVKSGNQYSFDDVSKKTYELKNLAQFLGDSYIMDAKIKLKNRYGSSFYVDVEGSNYVSAIRDMLSWTKSVNDVNNGRYSKIVDLLEVMHSISIVFESSPPSASSYISPIEGLNNPGDYVVLPSGWMRHAMLILVSLSAPDEYNIKIFNTGIGIKYHQSKIRNKDEFLSCPYYEVSRISKSRVLDPVIWDQVATIFDSDDDGTSPASRIYTLITSLSTDFSLYQQISPSIWSFRQSSGTCGLTVVSTLVRFVIADERLYKDWKRDIAFSYVESHLVPMQESHSLATSGMSYHFDDNQFFDAEFAIKFIKYVIENLARQCRIRPFSQCTKLKDVYESVKIIKSELMRIKKDAPLDHSIGDQLAMPLSKLRSLISPVAPNVCTHKWPSKFPTSFIKNRFVEWSSLRGIGKFFEELVYDVWNASEAITCKAQLIYTLEKLSLMPPINDLINVIKRGSSIESWDLLMDLRQLDYIIHSCSCPTFLRGPTRIAHRFLFTLGWQIVYKMEKEMNGEALLGTEKVPCFEKVKPSIQELTLDPKWIRRSQEIQSFCEGDEHPLFSQTMWYEMLTTKHPIQVKLKLDFFEMLISSNTKPRRTDEIDSKGILWELLFSNQPLHKSLQTEKENFHPDHKPLYESYKDLRFMFVNFLARTGVYNDLIISRIEYESRTRYSTKDQLINFGVDEDKVELKVARKLKLPEDTFDKEQRLTENRVYTKFNNETDSFIQEQRALSHRDLAAFLVESLLDQPLGNFDDFARFHKILSTADAHKFLSKDICSHVCPKVDLQIKSIYLVLKAKMAPSKDELGLLALLISMRLNYFNNLQYQAEEESSPQCCTEFEYMDDITGYIEQLDKDLGLVVKVIVHTSRATNSEQADMDPQFFKIWPVFLVNTELQKSESGKVLYNGALFAGHCWLARNLNELGSIDRSIVTGAPLKSVTVDWPFLEGQGKSEPFSLMTENIVEGTYSTYPFSYSIDNHQAMVSVARKLGIEESEILKDGFINQKIKTLGEGLELSFLFTEGASQPQIRLKNVPEGQSYVWVDEVHEKWKLYLTFVSANIHNDSWILINKETGEKFADIHTEKEVGQKMVDCDISFHANPLLKGVYSVSFASDLSRIEESDLKSVIPRLFELQNALIVTARKPPQHIKAILYPGLSHLTDKKSPLLFVVDDNGEACAEPERDYCIDTSLMVHGKDGFDKDCIILKSKVGKFVMLQTTGSRQEGSYSIIPLDEHGFLSHKANFSQSLTALHHFLKSDHYSKSFHLAEKLFIPPSLSEKEEQLMLNILESIQKDERRRSPNFLAFSTLFIYKAWLNFAYYENSIARSIASNEKGSSPPSIGLPLLLSEKFFTIVAKYYMIRHNVPKSLQFSRSIKTSEANRSITPFLEREFLQDMQLGHLRSSYAPESFVKQELPASESELKTIRKLLYLNETFRLCSADFLTNRNSKNSMDEAFEKVKTKVNCKEFLVPLFLFVHFLDAQDDREGLSKTLLNPSPSSLASIESNLDDWHLRVAVNRRGQQPQQPLTGLDDTFSRESIDHELKFVRYQRSDLDSLSTARNEILEILSADWKSIAGRKFQISHFDNNKGRLFLLGSYAAYKEFLKRTDGSEETAKDVIEKLHDLVQREMYLSLDPGMQEILDKISDDSLYTSVLVFLYRQKSPRCSSKMDETTALIAQIKEHDKGTARGISNPSGFSLNDPLVPLLHSTLTGGLRSAIHIAPYSLVNSSLESLAHSQNRLFGQNVLRFYCAGSSVDDAIKKLAHDIHRAKSGQHLVVARPDDLLLVLNLYLQMLAELPNNHEVFGYLEQVARMIPDFGNVVIYEADQIYKESVEIIHPLDEHENASTLQSDLRETLLNFFKSVASIEEGLTLTGALHRGEFGHDVDLVQYAASLEKSICRNSSFIDDEIDVREYDTEIIEKSCSNFISVLLESLQKKDYHSCKDEYGNVQASPSAHMDVGFTYPLEGAIKSYLYYLKEGPSAEQMKDFMVETRSSVSRLLFTGIIKSENQYQPIRSFANAVGHDTDDILQLDLENSNINEMQVKLVANLKRSSREAIEFVLHWVDRVIVSKLEYHPTIVSSNPQDLNVLLKSTPSNLTRTSDHQYPMWNTAVCGPPSIFIESIPDVAIDTVLTRPQGSKVIILDDPLDLFDHFQKHDDLNVIIDAGDFVKDVDRERILSMMKKPGKPNALYLDPSWKSVNEDSKIVYFKEGPAKYYKEEDTVIFINSAYRHSARKIMINEHSKVILTVSSDMDLADLRQAALCVDQLLNGNQRVVIAISANLDRRINGQFDTEQIEMENMLEYLYQNGSERRKASFLPLTIQKIQSSAKAMILRSSRPLNSALAKLFIRRQGEFGCLSSHPNRILNDFGYTFEAIKLYMDAVYKEIDEAINQIEGLSDDSLSDIGMLRGLMGYELENVIGRAQEYTLALEHNLHHLLWTLQREANENFGLEDTIKMCQGKRDTIFHMSVESLTYRCSDHDQFLDCVYKNLEQALENTCKTIELPPQSDLFDENAGSVSLSSSSLMGVRVVRRAVEKKEHSGKEPVVVKEECPDTPFKWHIRELLDPSSRDHSWLFTNARLLVSRTSDFARFASLFSDSLLVPANYYRTLSFSGSTIEQLLFGPYQKECNFLLLWRNDVDSLMGMVLSLYDTESLLRDFNSFNDVPAILIELNHFSVIKSNHWTPHDAILDGRAKEILVEACLITRRPAQLLDMVMDPDYKSLFDDKSNQNLVPLVDFITVIIKPACKNVHDRLRVDALIGLLLVGETDELTGWSSIKQEEHQ